MLTADLVQARVYRKQVRPRYIDTADEGNQALASELIDVFSTHGCMVVVPTRVATDLFESVSSGQIAP